MTVIAMAVRQMQRLNVVDARVALSRAMRLIERGDVEASEFLRDLAWRLEGEGWHWLSLELRLAAAEFDDGQIEAAKQHWWACWGYVAGIDRMQRR
jgi:hypothetical protein